MKYCKNCVEQTRGGPAYINKCQRQKVSIQMLISIIANARYIPLLRDIQNYNCFNFQTIHTQFPLTFTAL